MKDAIKYYFFDDGDAQACTYTRNSFTAKPDDLPVETGEQEELIDLESDEGALEKFKDFTLANFWLNVSSSYATITKNAITQLLVFPTAWECKQEFSTFLTIKSKTRKRLVSPRARFSMFCEQNIFTTRKIRRRKASAAIALLYKYLLVDELCKRSRCICKRSLFFDFCIFFNCVFVYFLYLYVIVPVTF